MKLVEALEPKTHKVDKVLALYNSDTVPADERPVLKAAILDEDTYSSAGIARSLKRAYNAQIDPSQVVNLRAKIRQGKATL